MNINKYNLYKELSSIGLINKTVKEYDLNLKASGFMDLTVEMQDLTGINEYPLKLYLTHYYKQNGDLMRDPDLTFLINVDQEIAIPHEFQMDAPPIYKCSFIDGEYDLRVLKELHQFALSWLANLKQQGHFNSLNINNLK